jgi:putative nucleotidyltransferase with HDIG domain
VAHEADAVTRAPHARGNFARKAEILGALSLATDLADGFEEGQALRTATTAARLATLAGRDLDTRRDAYFAGVLRFVGCTAFSHEEARDYAAGQDIGMQRAMATVDLSSARDFLQAVLFRVGKGAPPGARVRGVARLLTDPAAPVKFSTAQCEVAVRISDQLGMGAAVRAALEQKEERWDGRGVPGGLRGDALHIVQRLVTVAHLSHLFLAAVGIEGTRAMLRSRSAGHFDPDLAGLAEQHLEELVAVSARGTWADYLDAEPPPHARAEDDDIERYARAFARIADLKSPWRTGHSEEVARLAAAAAEVFPMTAGERKRVLLAALLHDVGTTAIPNAVWDKPRALDPVERDRMELHCAHSVRILRRTGLFADLAALVALHHERPDGGGYPQASTAVGLSAQILGAADVIAALTAARAHRPALTLAEAREVMLAQAREGRFEPRVVDAVLAAAGDGPVQTHGRHPDDLSSRELEVLLLVATGKTNKQIAADLALSTRTVDHHVANIFSKTRVSTRAAAALYAMEHGLLGGRAWGARR